MKVEEVEHETCGVMLHRVSMRCVKSRIRSDQRGNNREDRGISSRKERVCGQATVNLSVIVLFRPLFFTIASSFICQATTVNFFLLTISIISIVLPGIDSIDTNTSVITRTKRWVTAK